MNNNKSRNLCLRKLIFAAAFSLSTISTQAQVPAYVPAAGLKGWWSFSGNADDLSANGLHGAIFGASPAPDRFGNPESAYSFADSAYIITETGTGLPYGSAPRTISLWMKTSITTNPNNRDIFGYGVVGPSKLLFCHFRWFSLLLCCVRRSNGTGSDRG
jgi:hypothetical protein